MVVDAINKCLGFLKQEAVRKEDGNTIALLDKISRDVGSLQPEYSQFIPDPKLLSEEDKAEKASDSSAPKSPLLDPAPETTNGKKKAPVA
jgi:hypothetical protein